MARAWGQTEEEKTLLEFNARNQVTLWGPRGEIADYASKQWSGLLSSYYLPRWQMFFQRIGMALRDNMPLNQDGFLQKLLVFEQEWQTKLSREGDDDLPATPRGDALDIVQASVCARMACLRRGLTVRVVCFVELVAVLLLR
jgi:alpha-N-acetylglucosaminidase